MAYIWSDFKSYRGFLDGLPLWGIEVQNYEMD